MVFSEGDRNFINNASKGLEDGYDPGMREMLRLLEESGQTKSIYIRGKKNGSNEVTEEHIATVAQLEGDMHIAWFITGDILIVEPANAGVIKDYRSSYSPGPTPYVYTLIQGEGMPTVEGVINAMSETSDRNKFKVILRNDDPKNQETISDFQNFALELIKQRVERAEATQQEKLDSHSAQASTADKALRSMQVLFSHDSQASFDMSYAEGMIRAEERQKSDQAEA